MNKVQILHKCLVNSVQMLQISKNVLLIICKDNLIIKTASFCCSSALRWALIPLFSVILLSRNEFRASAISDGPTLLSYSLNRPV